MKKKKGKKTLFCANKNMCRYIYFDSINKKSEFLQRTCIVAPLWVFDAENAEGEQKLPLPEQTQEPYFRQSRQQKRPENKHPEIHQK